MSSRGLVKACIGIAMLLPFSATGANAGEDEPVEAAEEKAILVLPFQESLWSYHP